MNKEEKFMSQLKRTAALLLVMMMVLSVFAGCGGTPPTTATSQAATAAASVEATTATPVATVEPTAAPVDPLKDKVEISFALWEIGKAITDAPDAVRDALYAKLNFTYKAMNVTWDDYVQKIQIWAASGQLPDIFAIDAVGTANAKKWVDEGIIQPLPADLTPYPNVAKMMAGAGMEIYKMPLGDPNGKFYSLPRFNHFDADGWATDTGVHIRKDWMANVGVTAEPTNMDEFIDLMVKFANNDPDKNGKKDTIGLTCYNAGWLTWFLMNYEPGTQGWIKDSTGKWIPAFMTQGTLDGIKALKKLYDAGGLDKDFATLKGDEGRDKYATNKAGAYAHDASVSTIQDYVGTQFEKMNPTLKYSDIVLLQKPFKAPDGNYYRLISNPGWSETYINAKADPVKVDRIMKLFDYVMSEEGYNLIHYGLEGKDWKKEGDKIVLNLEKDANGNPVAPILKYPMSNMGYIAEWSGTHQGTAPNAQPIYQQIFQTNEDWLLANAKPQPRNLVIPLLDVPSKAKATENISDDIIKCVLSKDAEKTWNELIANYKANGYDKLIEEVNAAATAAGIK